MLVDTEQINNRIDIYRAEIDRSAHADILGRALDIVVLPQSGETLDTPSLQLARFMLFSDQTHPYKEDVQTGSLSHEAPEIAWHSLRQSAAALEVLTPILDSTKSLGEPYSNVNLPVLCRSLACNDTALVFVPGIDRAAIWNDGPRLHPESHNKYKTHTLLGWRVALQNGDMHDHGSRSIALSVARHHARQLQSYGVRWRVIDRGLKFKGAPLTSQAEREQVRFETNLQRPFDALDDALTRRDRCEIPTAAERCLALTETYLGVIAMITARRHSDSVKEIDPEELQFLSLVVSGLNEQLKSDSPLANMYEDVWNDTLLQATH